MTRKSTWCKKTVHLPKYHWKLGKTCQLICTISPQQKVYNFKPVDPFLSFHKTMFPIWEDTVHPSLQWSLIFLIRQRSLWEPTQSAWLRSRKAVLMETGLPARKASSIPLSTRPWLIPLSNGRMSWVFFRSWFGILLLICKTVIQFLIIFETLKLSRREICVSNFLPPCEKVPPDNNSVYFSQIYSLKKYWNLGYPPP